MNCLYCSKPVDPTGPFTYRRITAWERKGSGPTRRSGSDIVLREPRDEFACDDCVIRLKRGLSAAQGTLGAA